ncbi:MAG: molybdopterin-dependent oxidoreductase [Anaerolineales bacterium]|nr:molybdopterin-dependent oxidoreductase [Anaerolineales bacterium]MBS3752360.1 molybdopterin-dependent oxidoreductase [Anaerolineales bacterium]
MKRRRGTLFLILAALLLLLTACGGAPNVDWELTISGDVEDPTTFTYKELAKMEQVSLDEILMEKSTGEDEIRSWSGVELSELLDEAGAGEFSTITALAADGYAIEVTEDELESAIVALKDHEDWIANTTPDKGPIRLVTPETPANRWVFQLTEIQVNQ